MSSRCKVSCSIVLKVVMYNCNESMTASRTTQSCMDKHQEFAQYEANAYYLSIVMFIPE